MKTERPVHAIGPAIDSIPGGAILSMVQPAVARIGEGLLPERSVDVKEARGTKTTHA